MKNTINDKTVIDFGEKRDYLFKHIDINEKYGNPIIIDGNIIGGILVTEYKGPDGEKRIEMRGIEIIESLRNKGIGTFIVKEIMKQGDVLTGGISEKSAIPFWKSLGAYFYEVPINLIPSYIKKCEIMLAFFIYNDRKLIIPDKRKFEDRGFIEYFPNI